VVAVGSELPFSMAAFKSKLSLRYPILSDVNLKVCVLSTSIGQEVWHIKIYQLLFTTSLLVLHAELSTSSI
jgi:peroxiredoxin